MSDFTNSERAEVLSEALPHIKRYNGKIVVIKYGGNAMINEDLKNKVMRDIVLLWLVGVKVVLVHGGGPEITELMDKMGKKAEFVGGLRVTDKETVDIVQMVLAGKINKSLVNLLEKYGGKAMGISGIDADLIKAKPKSEALGYVGDITEVNPEVISDMLDKGYIPVVSTIARDEEGNTYNINGDTAAAAIAGALKAERMIMMTNIRGVLMDKNDPNSLVAELKISEAVSLMNSGIIDGGMIPKIDCCIEAIHRGVKHAVIIDGCKPDSIILELLTNEGDGTMITEG
ncbi:MAG: acetylglutamate kinase [Candidatus Methanomethylophilaceae archaeon]|nr:acetylglutamate kinase [Candidatus Methanomethylophilaceae archaeon]